MAAIEEQGLNGGKCSDCVRPFSVPFVSKLDSVGLMVA